MKKSMIKRSINAILCFAMLLGNFSIPGFAADADASLALEPEKRTISMTADLDLELPENEELFAGFVERELYGYEMNTFGTLAREQLNAAEQGLYDALKPKIETVAANGGSTAFSLSDVSGLKTKWTNTELGVTDIVDIQMVVSAFFGQFDIDNIMTALLSDCPFDLYWFDKTSSAYFGYRYVAEEGNDGAQAVVQSVTISDFEIGFSVAEDYKSDEYMVTTDVAKITTARNNAPQVVANNAGKSDTEKLAAYKDYICNAVSYNHTAADNDSTPYGDPWQLIYVFDGNSSTNVVCEGYSKAFQYLCDLSAFLGNTLCYSVSGWMNGGAHMWNIVTLDGKNYLVDVTSSDTGTVGWDGSMFLAGGSGSVAGGYVVEGIHYVYRDQTKGIWGADGVLELSAIDYVRGTSAAHSHSFVSDVCACGAVKISETTFPDANFRDYITAQEYGTDGLLTIDELNQVTSLEVAKKKIKDLTGLKHFKTLRELYCNDNQLTSLDVSGFTALTTLYCDNNQLTKLDMSRCSALTTLSCSENQLKSLDVSRCAELKNLFCNNNQLTALNVSNCTALENLGCRNNQLTDLDVRRCTVLTQLSCENNKLMGLNVSNCSALTELSCENNQLTSLNVSGCTELRDLYCYDNQLRSLDASSCRALAYLVCNNNQLEQLNVSNGAALEELYCENNRLTSLDLSGCAAITYLYCDGNQLTSLDLRGCTALIYLECSDNQLTGLDVSGCAKLKYLYCNNNSRTVSATQKQFDLSTLAGFDVSKASNWQGGTVSGNILTFTTETVTYAYDLGRGKTGSFTLRVCFHSWKDATCTAPKTCTRCGVTEGTPLPHIFDQEVVKDKYLVSEGTGDSWIVYKKSCKCGEAGEETFAVKFKDVPKGEYYYDAAMWAVEKGVTTGTGNGSTFEPNAICTRGQVVTFLWRAAGKPEPVITENPFLDVKSSEYYYKAVLWAAENGITTGTKNGDTFEPDAKCNRAQIVTFLSRARNGQASGSSNPFKDVDANSYYYDAVLWAVENKITTGTKDGTTFEPNANCTRGQVITFLYRAYKDDKPHAHDYSTELTAPTCTDEGYTFYKCSACGHSYTGDRVPATGHVNVRTETTEASCAAEGYAKDICSDCGTVVNQTTIPATGSHNWKTMRMSDAAQVWIDQGDYDYAEWYNFKDWNVNMCADCDEIDMETLAFAYSDYEAALIMLDYVNSLREEYYGTSEYNLVLDPDLVELSAIRAKQISVNFSHDECPPFCGENIVGGGSGIYSHFSSWKNSSGHYANMLDTRYKYFGYALHKSSDCWSTAGIYGVQLFSW